MIIETCAINDMFIITPEVYEDDRGSLHRSLCIDQLKKAGVIFTVRQGNISKNKKRQTLRGLHYQVEPHREVKLLSCLTGALYNVVLDLRKESSTFGQWTSIELSSQNNASVLVPEGCANGFLTLADDTSVHYYMGEFYSPESSRGIRYNDPLFSIRWPSEPLVVSKRDREFPDYEVR